MDFQILAKGIALAGCAIGAGCSLIAGIGERLWPVTVMVLNSYGFLQNLGENYGYTAD